MYIQVSKISVTAFGKAPIQKDTTFILKAKNGKVVIPLLKTDSLLVERIIKVRANKKGCGIKDLGYRTYYKNQRIKLPKPKVWQHDGGFFRKLAATIVYGLGLHPGYEQWSAKGPGYFGAVESNCQFIPPEDTNRAICYQYTVKYSWSKSFRD